MADSHERDASASGPRRVTVGWANMPPASGGQCARALSRAGFDVEFDGPDHMMVKRYGIPLVRIPLVDRLRPELLVAIARTAGLSAPEFIAHLVD